MAKAAPDSIENNQPEAGLDRLHTFVVKFLRSLCDKHGLTLDRSVPLHALMGAYIKKLREDGELGSEMSERILKSSIANLEAFNHVRDNHTLAHDNAILSRDEAFLIFNHVASTVRSIKAHEAELLRRQQVSVVTPWDEGVLFWDLLGSGAIPGIADRFRFGRIRRWQLARAFLASRSPFRTHKRGQRLTIRFQRQLLALGIHQRVRIHVEGGDQVHGSGDGLLRILGRDHEEHPFVRGCAHGQELRMGILVDLGEATAAPSLFVRAVVRQLLRRHRPTIRVQHPRRGGGGEGWWAGAVSHRRVHPLLDILAQATERVADDRLVAARRVVEPLRRAPSSFAPAIERGRRLLQEAARLITRQHLRSITSFERAQKRIGDQFGKGGFGHAPIIGSHNLAAQIQTGEKNEQRGCGREPQGSHKRLRPPRRMA